MPGANALAYLFGVLEMMKERSIALTPGGMDLKRKG
jgi:hypothetical protein